MADHEKQKNRLSERHQIMELLWRKKTDVEEKTCQHQCREWQRPCWNPNKSKKTLKTWFPTTLPSYLAQTSHWHFACFLRQQQHIKCFHPYVSLLNWHWYKNWKVHVSSTRRKGRLHRQSSGPGAFWNDDLALCTVHSLHTSRVSIPRICTNQLSLFRCNALQCMAGTSQVPQLGLLSLILKSIIRSLMPKAPIGACIRV